MAGGGGGGSRAGGSRAGRCGSGGGGGFLIFIIGRGAIGLDSNSDVWFCPARRKFDRARRIDSRRQIDLKSTEETMSVRWTKKLHDLVSKGRINTASRAIFGRTHKAEMAMAPEYRKPMRMICR